MSLYAPEPPVIPPSTASTFRDTPAARTRDGSLDAIKALAALAVVVLHATSGLVRLPDPASSAWWAADLFNACTRWSVPLFVMVSGVLLLGGTRTLSVGDFYRQRLPRILVPLAFWSAVYLLLREFTQPAFSLRDAVYLVVHGKPHYHLWYLYMIVGIYLLAPFVKRMTDTLSNAALGGLALGILAWAALDIGLPYESRTFLARAIPFLGYLLAGLWIHRQTPRLASGWLVAIVLGCVLADAAVTGLVTPWLGMKGVTVMEDEFNPLVIAMSLALFALLLRVRTVPAFVTRLSLVSLGIYVIHPLVLDALASVGVTGRSWHAVVGIPVTGLLAFALSALAAWVLSQVPLLRRTVS